MFFPHDYEGGKLSVIDWSAKAEALYQLGRDQEALEAARRGLAVSPSDGRLNLIAGQIARELGRQDEAEAFIDKAAQAPSTRVDALLMQGFGHQAAGEFSKAKAVFEQIVREQPGVGVAYLGWSQCGRFQTGDEWLLAQALEFDSQDPESKMGVEYALGKIFSEKEEFAQAMAHYDEANKLAKAVNLGGKPYDSAAHHAFNSRIKELFSKEFLKKYASIGRPENSPMLIVGMMRSGTTLLEQVISKHSEVEAAGEVDFWPIAGPRVINWEKGSLSTASVFEAADRYIKHLTQIGRGAARVTDKLPDNTPWLGLIHICFPKAKIIYVSRDPLDTCFSIYTTPYSQSPDYAHDQEAIALAYKEQAALMEHWQSCLPADSLLHVTYEDLVSNPEPTVRGILDFCGLDWQDACLSPQTHAGLIKTPSVWQARQKINTNSLGRARNYLPYLGALAQFA